MKEKNVIFGIRPVIEALIAGQEIEKILIARNSNSERDHELQQLIREKEVPTQKVPLQKLNRVTGKNHQGIIAYTSLIAYQPLDEIVISLFEKGENPLILILDRITDVRNFGAIARTADAAGVHCIVVPLRESAQINADAIKTSAGALSRVAINRSKNLKETVRFLKQSGIVIYGCTEKANNLHTTAVLQKPTCIIMGSEENGISPELLLACDEIVKIKMKGAIGSLNVSVACGIMLYEAVRQRDELLSE